MITIVIPLYNKEDYIETTLQSVLNQTFKNFEVIVVDDGSTDASLSVLEKIIDNRIRIISIENGGVSVARNTGIQAANYNYISFLDADDWWANTFLEEIIQGINKYPSNKVFATGRCRVFKNEIDLYQNKFLPKKDTIGLVDYIEVISENLPPINSSNVVILKEELFYKGLFNPKQNQHEDHDLWLRLCITNKIVFNNKNLSFYRKDIVNSSSRSSYKADDFLQYLNTIVHVKKHISNKRNLFFKKYYLKFIIISYLKNQRIYSKEKRKELCAEIYKIIGFPYSLIIFSTKFLSFEKIFYLKKKL